MPPSISIKNKWINLGLEATLSLWELFIFIPIFWFLELWMMWVFLFLFWWFERFVQRLVRRIFWWVGGKELRLLRFRAIQLDFGTWNLLSLFRFLRLLVIGRHWSFSSELFLQLLLLEYGVFWGFCVLDRALGGAEWAGL